MADAASIVDLLVTEENLRIYLSSTTLVAHDETMEEVTVKERFVHGGVAFLIASVLVSYSAFVGFGDNVFEAYTSKNCSSHYFEDINSIRSATQGIWLGGFGCLVTAIVGMYHKVFEHAYIVDGFVVLGICGIVLSGLFAVLVALTGTCVDEVGSSTNGEVYDFAVFSGFAFGLAVLQAWLTDVVAPQHKSYTIAGTTIMTALLFVARTVLVGVLFDVTHQSKADFKSKYLRLADLVHPRCVNASHGIDSSVYDDIKIFNVKADSFEDHMVGLSAALLATICAEFICRTIDVCQAREQLKWLRLEGYWKYLGCWFQRITDVSLAVFLFSFLLANEVAGCPTYNTSSTDDNNLSFLYITFVVSQTA